MAEFGGRDQESKAWSVQLCRWWEESRPVAAAWSLHYNLEFFNLKQYNLWSCHLQCLPNSSMWLWCVYVGWVRRSLHCATSQLATSQPAVLTAVRWHLNNLEWTHLWSLICILLICIQLLVINTYSRIPTHVVATSMFTQTSWQNTYHIITCVVSMNTLKLTRWQSTSHTITCVVATDTFKLTSSQSTSCIITCVAAIDMFKLTCRLNTSCIITCVVAINTFKSTSWQNTFSYYHPWLRTDQWNTTKLHGWVCNNLFTDLAVWNNTSCTAITAATSHTAPQLESYHQQPGILNHYSSRITHSPTAWLDSLSPLKLSPCSLKVD